MAVETKAIIDVQVRGAQQAENQLDGVSQSFDDLSKSTDKAAKSTDRAAAATQNVGKRMEQTLQPIDDSLKGFDRLNGILGQLTNATRLLSGVAFVELGTQFLDIVKKATNAGKAIQGIAKSLRDTAKSTERFAASVRGLAGGGGIGALLSVPDKDIDRFLKLQESAAALEAQYITTIQRRSQLEAEAAQLERRVLDIGRTLAETTQAGFGPAGFDFFNKQSAELQARLALVTGELKAMDGSTRPLLLQIRRLGREMERIRSTVVAPGSGNPPPEADARFIAGLLGIPMGAGGLIGGTARRLGEGIDGAAPAGGLASLFPAVASQIAAAQAEAALFDKRLSDIRTTALGVGQAFNQVGGALGALQGALAQAGIQSEALARVMAGVQAAQMGANAAMSFADGLKALAGGPLGLFPAPNPALAAANFAAAAAYTGAAAAYGAVAAGAGGESGGGSIASGGVPAAPSSGASFGGGAASTGPITINVNSPGVAFMSRNEQQAAGNVMGTALIAAMNQRGSGLRAGLRRQLGRS